MGFRTVKRLERKIVRTPLVHVETKMRVCTAVTRTRFASIFGDAREVANVNHLVVSEWMKCTLVADVSSLRVVRAMQRSRKNVVVGSAWSTEHLLS